MDKQWYVIRTRVGYEQRVKAALQQKVRERSQTDAFGEIVVPTEKVIDLVRGKKQTVERRLFPGYLQRWLSASANSRTAACCGRCWKTAWEST
jgi:transcriptional antiterminator NusG